MNGDRTRDICVFPLSVYLDISEIESKCKGAFFFYFFFFSLQCMLNKNHTTFTLNKNDNIDWPFLNAVLRDERSNLLLLLARDEPSFHCTVSQRTPLFSFLAPVSLAHWWVNVPSRNAGKRVKSATSNTWCTWTLWLDDHTMIWCNIQVRVQANWVEKEMNHPRCSLLVFPWILADYDSKVSDTLIPLRNVSRNRFSQELNLTSAATFRDLSKPMGAQTENRLVQFQKRFAEWDDPTGSTPAYHYGTHYSSAMIVASYLVRTEPFAQVFLRLQVNRSNLVLKERRFSFRVVISILPIECFIVSRIRGSPPVATTWPMWKNWFLNSSTSRISSWIPINSISVCHQQSPRFVVTCPFACREEAEWPGVEWCDTASMVEKWPERVYSSSSHGKLERSGRISSMVWSRHWKVIMSQRICTNGSISSLDTNKKGRQQPMPRMSFIISSTKEQWTSMTSVILWNVLRYVFRHLHPKKPLLF